MSWGSESRGYGYGYGQPQPQPPPSPPQPPPSPPLPQPYARSVPEYARSMPEYAQPVPEYEQTLRLLPEQLGPVRGLGPEPARPRAGGRDRYFDALRAVALVRVVAYHTFGWAWAGMVFPSMGVMFALAGSLMAKSLERPAFTVVRSRMRRLLPPSGSGASSSCWR